MELLAEKRGTVALAQAANADCAGIQANKVLVMPYKGAGP